MLMTYTSPEQIPTSAESVGQADLPVGSRHLKPDGKSCEEPQSTFELQFSSCREMLHFIACRILTSVDVAETAVRNCHLTASRNPSKFENEGAFKSWLVRILIDESMLLLPKRQSGSTASSQHLPPRH
jgi:hypothetical protein